MTDQRSGTAETIGNYVGGRWVEPGGDAMDVVNPATGEILSQVGFSTEADVDEVVRRA